MTYDLEIPEEKKAYLEDMEKAKQQIKNKNGDSRL